MKDEEMAEEYICNGKCQDDITRNYVHCKTCTRIKDFLAGLKAGRPQWHDLRKDPKDLPKDENYVLVSNGKDWTKGFYKDKKWNIISLVGFTKIIMWKEIKLPKESE